MDGDTYSRAKDIVDRALARPAAEREAFIDGACGSDKALRRDVESWLASIGAPSGFLEKPAMRICTGCRTPVAAGTAFCQRCGAVAADDPRALIGETLDGTYRLDELLGEGGMGAVYRATHLTLKKTVAIKMLKQEQTASPAALARFQREGRAAQLVRHPNAVEVQDLRWTQSGTVYLVLEYVAGRTLRQELEQNGRLPETRVVWIAREVAGVLDVAHAAGVVHRDLKPDNVMVVVDESGVERVKVLDLGIAKLVESAREAGATTLTAVGARLGTPLYMPPEQWGMPARDGGPDIDGRADVYSLSAMVFELASGRPPFVSEAREHTAYILDLQRQHCYDEALRLDRVAPGCSAALAEAVARGLSKDRGKRPPLAGAFAAALLWPGTSFTDQKTIDERVPLGGRGGDGSAPPLGWGSGYTPTEVEVLLRPLPSQIAIEIPPRRTGVIASLFSAKGPGPVIEVVLIQPGEFMMGSEERGSGEEPVHRVRITRPYYIGKYEVTQEQWKAVMGGNPSYFKGDARLPVDSVSWEDCQEFIGRLNSLTDGGWRMPTEAEWEYACRAGSSGDYAGVLDEMGWYKENSGGKTHLVGTKKANGWGLYDMHGNVWEWCSDWYGGYASGEQVDPVGPSTGSYRVRRGGGWFSTATNCRSAFRGSVAPGDRSFSLGLRLARTVQ